MNGRKIALGFVGAIAIAAAGYFAGTSGFSLGDAVGPAQAEDAATYRAPLDGAEFTDSQQTEIESMIRGYLLAHPEVIRDAINELQRRDDEAAQADQVKAIADEQGSALRFRPPGRSRQPEGRRHPGRVLRLQLRLLQARPRRHAEAHRDRQEPPARAEGVPGPRRRLGRGGAGLDRRQDDRPGQGGSLPQRHDPRPRAAPTASTPSASPRNSVSIARS